MIPLIAKGKWKDLSEKNSVLCIFWYFYVSFSDLFKISLLPVCKKLCFLLLVQVRGGQLWGTDVYTDDSDLVAGMWFDEKACSSRLYGL